MGKIPGCYSVRFGGAFSCVSVVNRTTAYPFFRVSVFTMSEPDIRYVLGALDQALNVFRQNEGRLTASQIRARSMISVTRAEMAQALAEVSHDPAAGTELFIDGAVVMTPVALGHPESQRSA
jgi:hypothetical protein